MHKQAIQYINDENELIEHIFDNYYEKMFRFAESYVYDSQMAEDIVQDVLLGFLEKKTKLVKSESIFSFLLTSVKHKCIDHIRKINIEDKNKQKLMEAHIASNTIEYSINDELLKSINSAIEELPDQCKEIFKLTVINGLKYKEAAEELNTSIDTIKVQKNRAVNYLKKKVFALNENPFLIFFLKKL